MNNKPKILYINGSFLNDNGAAVIAKNTEELFQKKGFETAIFTVKGFYDDNYKFAEYFPEQNVHPKTLSKLIKWYYNPDVAKNLKLLIDEFKPDIIHVHSIRSSSLTYAVLKPCIESKKPIIMTLHDCFLICPTMMLIKGNGNLCKNIPCKGFNKSFCIINNCALRGFKESIILSLMSFINKITRYDKHITKFITPSEALQSLMVKYNDDITEDKIVTINNFLSNSEFGNIEPNYNNKGYFLYIGRLSKEKGVHYLLQAAKDLPRNIDFHIVGEGLEEENLKQYVKDNNLENIKFLGHKNREEIKEEYQNCISIIVPSNWFEIFGLINIEAFINGKPVIATSIGGIPEIVEHNKTGLLFEPANIEQLKECIIKYWNNPDLVIEHGKNAYQKAKIQFTQERYYNELLNIYKEVINE